jgi:2-C-methyl-D-erythritol 2,4-cyclodiphosphate synthase
VQFPHSVGLVGHSDADVLVHAMCDALLGAAALGDIGKHFPNTSRRYENISSLVLLEKVGSLLARNSFQIVNIDATVLLERPKILKFAPAMAKAIAGCLHLSSEQISIKATTNEGLGFIGRGEGCAALAIASITSLSL